MEARVSDFGLAMLVKSDVAGTFGYLALVKGDVYSFGVVLLELLISKKPMDEEFLEEGTKLVTWISFSTMVAPSVLSAYIGQAPYLTKYPGDVYFTFYKSIPGHLYWPMFVVAMAVAVIASQAMISGAFAIISQSLRLGCFPRVKVIHTST
ncbi:hypothetical protein Droror1_Dr00015182, partial [Drosera rotundifolia]